MRHVAALAGALLLPVLLPAQGAPGTNLTVDVAVAKVSVTGDVTRVEYRLTNRAESREQLFMFIVDARAPLSRIDTPDPAEDWATRTDYRGARAAVWTVLGDALQPGTTGPTLGFEAQGLPTVVRHWVRGYQPPAPLPDNIDPHEVPVDPRTTGAVEGRTVGVESFPADRRPEALLVRLRELTGQACGDLQWITSAGVCSSLMAHLNAAAGSLEQGQREAARGQLESFRQELHAQHGPQPGKHVTASAYWLLRPNAEAIVSALASG